MVRRKAPCALPTALGFLTMIPVGRTGGPEGPTFTGVGRWFPVVGLIIGLLVFGCAWFGRLLWSGQAASALAVAAWTLLTGGLHLDGLADTADGLAGGRSPRHRLAIMKDSRIGTFGALALIITLLLKFVLVTEIDDGMILPILVLSPAIGRFAQVPAIYFFPSARDEGLGRLMKSSTTQVDLAVAGTVCVVAALVLAGPWGVAAATLAAASGIGVAFVLTKKLGGLTGDGYGALCEIVEVAALAALTAGQGLISIGSTTIVI